MTKKEPEQQEVTKAKKAPKGATKMTHPDGRIAYAHPSMIPAYKSGGFKGDK